MSTPFPRRFFICVLCVAAVLILAGCSEPSSTGDKQRQTQSSSAIDRDQGLDRSRNQSREVHQEVNISYPGLDESEAGLQAILEANSERARQEFTSALPNPDEFPELAERRYELRLDYQLAGRSQGFTSVRLQGFMDTGGAHPVPIEGGFVYSASRGEIVEITDLFDDPQAALMALSAYSRDQLADTLSEHAPGDDEASAEAQAEWRENMTQMLDDGLEPVAENFAEFNIAAEDDGPATSLELIFPPYQVAPYVYGTQTVEVPAAVFSEWLKPEWQPAFAN